MGEGDLLRVACFCATVYEKGWESKIVENGVLTQPNPLKRTPMNDSEKITAHVEKLRADLISANLVLSALIDSLPPETHLALLEALARLSVMQDATAEKIQIPEASLSLVRQGVERHYQHLQGLYKLRRS
jgi:hypothetical protein